MLMDIPVSPEHTMMVVVAGRRGGKTQATIQWLLEGRPLDEYPFWSRVIIGSSHEQVLDITRRVREATEHLEDTPVLWDIRKAIWTPDDLIGLQKHRGVRGLEFAVDNAELVIEQILNQRLSFITVTGQLASPSPGYTFVGTEYAAARIEQLRERYDHE